MAPKRPLEAGVEEPAGDVLNAAAVSQEVRDWFGLSVAQSYQIHIAYTIFGMFGKCDELFVMEKALA